MSQRYEVYTDEQLEADLDSTEGVDLPKDIRRDILIHFHLRGETVSQICDLLHLKRHKVRSVVDPDYRNPRKGREKIDLDDSTAEKRQTLQQKALMSEKSKKYDADATPEDCKEDLRRVQRENEFTYITRTMYRLLGKYSEATWNRHFGTFQEFRRQAELELNRYQHDMERKVAKHASLDHYEEFYRSEVQDYLELYPRKGPSREVHTLLSVSDAHDIEVDPFTLAVSIDVAKRLQPDIIVFNGDMFDMYEFSRFDMDPRRVKPGERARFVVNNIFRPFREACPDAQLDFWLGNHEWRILKHMANKTPNLQAFLSDFCDMTLEDLFGVRELEINVHCKWDMRAWQPKDVTGQVNQNFGVYWDCFVTSHIADFGFGMSGTSGHVHKPETKVGYSQAAGGPIVWTTTGCLRNTDEDYVMGVNRHVNGFGLFHIMPRTKQVVSENIIVRDFAAVAGKYYHRMA